MSGRARTPAQQRERAAGVGSRRGLCEGMRVRGGGAVTDWGLGGLGGVLLGLQVAGWGQI